MFKFDFKIESEKELVYDTISKETKNDNPKTGNDNVSTIDCYTSKQIFATENVYENIDLYRANSMEVSAGNVTMTYIKSGFLLQTFNDETTKDISKAEENHSDLIPGIYEGGAKIWECTDDLILYLSTNYLPSSFKNKKVLDLGCGSGVLGLYGHLCGASVEFQDYNEDVLQKITIPNFILNLPENDNKNMTAKFYCGDWSYYTKLTKGEDKFDYIFSSETIYNPKNQQKLLDTFDAKLNANGIVLLAAKIYYFGVGGGIREFEHLIQLDKRFKSRVVWRSSEGLSREILEINKLK